MNKFELDKLVQLSQKPLEDKWLESFHPSHEPVPYWRFLYHYILQYKPAVSIEIGTFLGHGSAHMAAAASTYGGIVLGVDVNKHEMTSSIIPEKYGNYHFYLGKAAELAPTIFHALAAPINLVFQDSSHHYYESHQEWNMFSQLLDDDNFLWVCDDITEAFHDPMVDPPSCSMVTYFNEVQLLDVRLNKYIFPDKLHKGNTIGVICNAS